MSTLGERIRIAREQKNMKQAELADAIGVKSGGIISNWENDINKPDADKIASICHVLGVSASYLLDYYGKGTDGLTAAERDMLILYRRLDDLDRGRLLERAETFLEADKYKKDSGQKAI